jgi:hypothetical protein
MMAILHRYLICAVRHAARETLSATLTGQHCCGFDG